MCSFSVRAWAHYALVAFLFGAFSGMTFGNGQVKSIPDSAYLAPARQDVFKAVVLLLGEKSDGWYVAGTGFFTTEYDIFTAGHVPRSSYLRMKALVTDDAYHQVLQTIPISSIDIYPGRIGTANGPDIAHLRASVAFAGTPVKPIFEKPAIGTEFTSVGFGMVSVVGTHRVEPFDGYKRLYTNDVYEYGGVGSPLHYATATLDDPLLGAVTPLEGGGQDFDSGSPAGRLVNGSYEVWGLSSFSDPNGLAVYGQITGYETLAPYETWYHSVVVPEPSSVASFAIVAVFCALRRRGHYCR